MLWEPQISWGSQRPCLVRWGETGSPRINTLHPPVILCSPGPPSAPVNLISSVNGTSVTLEWTPPLDLGGRSDITYNAVCRRCPWALGPCEKCGRGTRFVPQQTSLVQASLLVANLLAHMNYSFWIEAVNGVSDLSPEPRQAAVVNITTNQAGRRRRSVLGPSPPWASERCPGLAAVLGQCLPPPALPSSQDPELQAPLAK